jgi:hypothetical protein
LPQGNVGTIVPLYSYPTSATWDTFVALRHKYRRVPVTAIVDPANGPGVAPDANYTDGIQSLRANDIVVIGYIDTAYAQKSLLDVESEISTWKQFYPDINGIFLDQMSNVPGNESYYSDLRVYAESVGLSPTVGNPGTDTIESYAGTVDTMFIYENYGPPDLSAIASSWYVGHDKREFGVIPYGVSVLDRRFVKNMAALVGWIYVTDDTLPNPWDTLPPYFRKLLSMLRIAGRTRPPRP